MRFWFGPNITCVSTNYIWVILTKGKLYMLDITKPVRHRDQSNIAVKIIGQIEKSEDHHDRPMLIVVTQPTGGRQRVGYRNLDGSHPNGITGLDLVNEGTGLVASIYHTKITAALANALMILWRENHTMAVVDVVRSIDPNIHQSDILKYFSGLWGGCLS